jgi:two-component system nitrogen regulation response regulator GlnG
LNVGTAPSESPPAPCGSVLIADDEESIRWVLRRACEEDGHSVEAVATGTEAVAALRTRRPDVALIDIRLPDMSGLDALRQARAEHLDTPVIIITAQNTMANAIEATKRGAYDYLTKPFELDDVRRLIRRAMELRRMTRELEQLRGALGERYELVVGKTAAMQEIYKIIGRVAPTDATALIQGETGTGKELVARAIHHHSVRAGPFVAVNCSAIPHDLLESELFGYERGAFTGAADRRIGKFEAAARGTLFLDEVADMSLDLQAKLLRVLQEKEFTRIGSRELIRLDARIIAATNQDLEAAVQARRFRDDLFFRLNVVLITVPPLRDRRADIPQLIDFFIDKINRDIGTPIVGLAASAREALLRHDWPGNVRELENTLLRAAVLARGRTITLEDLALRAGVSSRSNAADLLLEDAVRQRARECLHQSLAGESSELHTTIVAAVERPLIEFVLEETGGNQLRAAAVLGLNRNTLRKKISELGVVLKRPVKDKSSG